jgi:hypothetical protein
VFVWAVLLVMPENLDNTTTAGRPTCVNNHINISTDDMCYGRFLRTNSGVPRNFVRGGGSTNSVEDR